jgi:MFS family permease
VHDREAERAGQTAREGRLAGSRTSDDCDATWTHDTKVASPDVRRLLLLICVVVCIDTLLYAALVPLLPRYADEFDLTKGGAGLLVAAYGIGVLLGGLPGGLAAARYGPRRAVLVGLSLTAVASLGFAAADGVWTLGLARFAQGLGSSLSWAGGLAWLVLGTPRARRGEMLGTAIGAAVFGALLGPVLGAAAASVGEGWAFSGVALACAALVAWAAVTPGAPRDPQPVSAVVAALRERRVLAGLWLMVMPAVLFAVLAVLVPLRLGDAGWSAAAVGAVFVAGASLEVVLGPLVGRFSDRRGRLAPLRIALVASLAVSLAFAVVPGTWPLAVLVGAAALAYGAFYAPAMALLSDGAERAGLAQALGFGVMNAAWALGNAAGPSLGGELAERAGDAAAYLVGAGLCFVTLLALAGRAIPRPAAADARLLDR